MITGIIMASGFSRRMKKNKLLMDIDEVPIIEKVIKTVKNSNLENVLLIYRDEEIKKIGDKYKIPTLYNDKANCGQSEAMKLGIVNSLNNTDGYMFFVGDQPFLKTDTINLLIDFFNKRKDSIIVPRYNGHRGNPVIFPSVFKEKLLLIKGDEGGRNIIRDNFDDLIYVDINNAFEGKDIDTWEEYKNFNNEIDSFQN